MNIGEKISELMAKRGTNAKELANKIGVTPSTIYSLIQRGSSRIDENLKSMLELRAFKNR